MYQKYGKIGINGYKLKAGVCMKGTEFYIAGIKPEDYKIKDIRANKPICFMDKRDTSLSVVLEEIDSIKYMDDNNHKRKLEYCAPNNVSILLSTSKRFIKKSERIFNTTFSNDNFFEKVSDKEKKLYKNSSIIYDYIETIQVAIVFSYTALESFANLSIPEGYFYEMKNNKGILEKYDKDNLERWMPLKDKLSKVLVELFKTRDIRKEDFWNDFCEFEKIRNSIIHQKAINGRDFYKNYFNKDIFKFCEVSEKIIIFFINNNNSKLICPLWPWINGAKNYIPISYNVEDKVEILDDLFENSE